MADRLEGVDAKVNALALKVAADIAELQTMARRASEDRAEDRRAVSDMAEKLDELGSAFGRFEAAASARVETEREAAGEAATRKTHGLTTKQVIIMALALVATVVVPFLVTLLQHALGGH